MIQAIAARYLSATVQWLRGQYCARRPLTVAGCQVGVGPTRRSAVGCLAAESRSSLPSSTLGRSYFPASPKSAPSHLPLIESLTFLSFFSVPPPHSLIKLSRFFNRLLSFSINVYALSLSQTTDSHAHPCLTKQPSRCVSISSLPSPLWPLPPLLPPATSPMSLRL